MQHFTKDQDVRFCPILDSIEFIRNNYARRK